MLMAVRRDMEGKVVNKEFRQVPFGPVEGLVAEWRHQRNREKKEGKVPFGPVEGLVAEWLRQRNREKKEDKGRFLWGCFSNLRGSLGGAEKELGHTLCPVEGEVKRQGPLIPEFCLLCK
ncbi:hypothetical protein NDU88_005227 [Pleurodeles waltl]|uniref:Uncharacterized protein n=1 Tax=Pleurodeles waltl TaxID=8319 RepID=A0AAV7LKJ4_PLEWA|nr:hypothetical protein NDU88_005227 [Pleurodeles waltl]